MQNQKNVEIIDAELVMASQPRTNPDQKLFIERLLSPTTLGWMMSTGGGLLVFGFAVWLWSVGIFENPFVLAVSTGATNLAWLIGGIYLFVASRYRLAGRGLTLLASLSMPLNLWLYDSQGLVTLESGNLWIPALMCSIIYAAIARLTRDHLSVYTLVGGIMMTGVLFVLGAHLATVWTVFAISTFLVVLGVICIHADHWFESEAGAFSRLNFGLSFFRSGQLSVAIGLGLLFAGPWLLFGNFPSTAKVWTMCLLATAFYAYCYTNTGDRRHGFFSAMLVVVGAWFAVIFLVWLNIELTISLVCLALSTAMLLANVYRFFGEFKNEAQRLVHIGFTVSIAVCSLMFAGADLVLANPFLFVDWIHVLQLLLVSGLIFSMPGIWNTDAGQSRHLAVGLGAAIFNVAVLSAMLGAGISNVGFAIAAVSSVSVVVALASHWVSRELRQIGIFCSAFAISTLVVWGGVLIGSAAVKFTSTLSIFTIVNLLLTFAITNFKTGSRLSLAGSGICINLFAFQIAIYFDLLNGFAIVAGLSIAGLMILAFSRIDSAVRRQWESDTNFSIQNLANSVICIGAVASCLFTVSELFASTLSLAHVGLLLSQLVAIGSAAIFTTCRSWRNTFIVVATGVVLMAIIVHFNISTLTVLQRMEVGSLALGLLMVVVGHIGWAKENSDRDDTVSFNLIVGSTLLAGPLAFGIVIDRFAVETTMGIWRYVHEIGGIAVGLSLLAAGVLCRIRSTTLMGIALLSTAVISNILLIDLPQQLQTTSAIMMIGGGVFFSISLVLSIYRDRIISLPEKIKNGKGIFQVLKWR